MDRDDFIIAVFMDEEVITIEICGEYFKLECDKDIFAYLHPHYRYFFPKLMERSLFVRQAANLWQVKATIQKRLVLMSGRANDPIPVIALFPYQRVSSPELYKTVVSRVKLILATMQPKICTTMASDWACASRVWI